MKVFHLSLDIFSFSHLLICSFLHLRIYAFSHFLIFTFTHLRIFSFTHLLICSFAHFYIYAFTHLRIFSFSGACVRRWGLGGDFFQGFGDGFFDDGIRLFLFVHVVEGEEVRGL